MCPNYKIQPGDAFSFFSSPHTPGLIDTHCIPELRTLVSPALYLQIHYCTAYLLMSLTVGVVIMQYSEAKQQLIEGRGWGGRRRGAAPFLCAGGSCFHLSSAHFTSRGYNRSYSMLALDSREPPLCFALTKRASQRVSSTPYLGLRSIKPPFTTGTRVTKRAKDELVAFFDASGLTPSEKGCVKRSPSASRLHARPRRGGLGWCGGAEEPTAFRRKQSVLIKCILSPVQQGLGCRAGCLFKQRQQKAT